MNFISSKLQNSMPVFPDLSRYKVFPKCDQSNIWDTASKRIPIVSWLPKYGCLDGVSDMIAGLTVGLTLMPQAIAYAALAGLEPQYGLYSSFAGSLVYILFGTVKEVNIGPTALISLLTFTYTHDTNPDFAVLLCFLSGLVELTCGLLNLGFFVEFVSIPVTAGFSSAAAVLIAASQIKGLLGLTYKSVNLVEDWNNLMWHISETRSWDVCLSFVCITILLLMKQLQQVKINRQSLTKIHKAFNKSMWLLSTSRNVIIVVSTAAFAYFLSKKSMSPFLLTGDIKSGFPSVGLPPTHTKIGNTTYTFIDMCSHLGTGIIVVPLISILGNIAIAKAFADDKIVDATQEMMTLGLCNIVGSFFHSIPVSGAFSRSAVNNASGVRTPLGGLYSGLLVILALSFLTPYFFYIPKATLACVIFCAVIFMIEIKLIGFIWKSNRRDLVPFFFTFIICLWHGVEVGILAGLSLDVLYLLYTYARPKCITHKIRDTYSQEYLVISPSSGLLFPSADYIRSQVLSSSKSSGLPVVLDCRHVSKIDYTGLQGLKALIEDMKKINKRMFFQNLQLPIIEKLKLSVGSDFLTIDALGQVLRGGRKISSTVMRRESISHALSDIKEIMEKDPTILSRMRKQSRMGDMLHNHERIQECELHQVELTNQEP